MSNCQNEETIKMCKCLAVCYENVTVVLLNQRQADSDRREIHISSMTQI